MDNKKVLMLAYHYPPENSSSVFRTLYMSNHLFENSQWQPYILTVDPKHTTKGYLYDEMLLKQIHQNTCVFRTSYIDLREKILRMKYRKKNPLHKEAKPPTTENMADTEASDLVSRGIFTSGWQKLKDFITDELLAFPDRHMAWILHAAVNGIKVAQKNNIELIYSTGGPWSSHAAAFVIKLVTGLPMVLDYRDPWYGNPYNENRSRLYAKLSKALENIIIQNANHIIFNTRSLAELYQKNFFIDKEKYTIISNGYEGSPFINKPVSNSNRKEIKIVHAGNLYGGRSPDNFIKAVLNVSSNHGTNIKVQLIGAEQSTHAGIKKKFGKTFADKQLEVTPRVSHSRVLQYLADADILLIFQQGTRVQIPRKLYEYMMFGKPILAVCENGELSKILEECKIGYSVADNTQIIEAALTKLIENPEDCDGDITKLEKYSNKNLSTKFAKCFDAVTGKM